MDIIEKAKVLGQMIGYKLTQAKYDIDYCPSGLDPEKFISARQAVQQIQNSSTVMTTGMAAHGRCSLFYWAVRDLFNETGSPSNLRWVSVSAQGGRGDTPKRNPQVC